MGEMKEISEFGPPDDRLAPAGLDPIEAYVPHRGAMLLLSRLIEVDAHHAVAEVRVPFDGLFVHDGQVPSWVGIEYMAQTVAAWSGARGRREDQPPRFGFLLGSRRFEVHCDGFACGAVLRIEAAHEFVSDAGLGMFDCRILQADEVLATARVTVFEPEDSAGFLMNN